MARRRLIVVLAIAAIASACAPFARRIDTPAKLVTVDELNREPAPPNERYYIILFGSNSRLRSPRHCHTWATGIKVTENGPNVAPCVEHNTISWMPATLKLEPYRIWTEPGVNLEMHESIRDMTKDGQIVYYWGPFEISRGAYLKGLMQKEFLESGQVAYQEVDTIGEAAIRGNGCNCIHAVIEADSGSSRGRYPLARYGELASKIIVEAMDRRGYLIEPNVTHDWLIPALELDQYQLHHKSYRGAPFRFMDIVR